ncbi:MAG TPA: hypothetical protein VGK25_03520, partial [Ignavibacteria bacterium]
MLNIRTILSSKKNILSIAIVLTLLFSLCNQSYSQGRDRSKYQVLIDTGFSFTDTSKIADTTKIKIAVDSTARIKYFKYEREDRPVTGLGEKIHPLLLNRSNMVEYKLSFDSLNNVVIAETFESEQVKVPYVIPLDKYLQTRTEFERKNQLYSILADFYKIETEDELERL